MAGLLAVGLRLPRLADQLTNRRHVGPKLQFPRRPALTGHKQCPTDRLSCEAGKATRETNSALKTRRGFGRRQKQRITARRPRSCETEPAPQGRHGSSSVGSSAFRAVGCQTRRRTQRSSTACRKCAKHIQAVPARQPLFDVIIGSDSKFVALVCAVSLARVASISPTAS